MSANSAIPENGASTAAGGADGVGLLTSSMVADNPGTEKVGFRTNVMSGFQAGYSYEDAGTAATANNDVSAFIVTYDFGVAKIGYASSSTGSTTSDGAKTDQSQVGIGTSFGGVGIRFARGSSKTAGANGAADTSNISTRDVGLTYSVDDALSLYATFSDSKEETGTNANDKMTSSTFGLSYTIAPGVSGLLETASADYTDNTTGSNNSDGQTTTTAKISVSF